MLVRFNDIVFLSSRKQWFVWDSTFMQFRPIDGYVWDGQTWVMDDRAYCKDPMEKFFGFGSHEMQKTCEALTRTYETQIERAPCVPFLDMGTSEWFRDRPVSFGKCAVRDTASWKRLVARHPHTCRTHPRNKFTKRTLPTKK